MNRILLICVKSGSIASYLEVTQFIVTKYQFVFDEIFPYQHFVCLSQLKALKLKSKYYLRLVKSSVDFTWKKEKKFEEFLLKKTSAFDLTPSIISKRGIPKLIPKKPMLLAPNQTSMILTTTPQEDQNQWWVLHIVV